jgi:hypothetical protein
MKKIIPFILLLTTWIAEAQVPSSNFLEKLKGTYQAAGTSFNMPADIEMTWASTLGGRYSQLQYKILMHRKDGKDQLFEGTAFYKPSGENTFKATWFDSNGSMHPITATNDENTLTSLWGTPETEMGKTTYKVVDDKTVEVTDFVLKKDGSWQLFNKSLLVKR